MKLSDYKETKLSIYEKAADGLISDNDKVKLLAMLEAKKDEETLSEEDIEKFFKNLTDMYPDLEKDIEKLSDKVAKVAGGESEDSGESKEADDDTTPSDEGETEDNPVEESASNVLVSEKALELFEMVQSL
jgi:hypothetical protein